MGSRVDSSDEYDEHDDDFNDVEYEDEAHPRPPIRRGGGNDPNHYGMGMLVLRFLCLGLRHHYLPLLVVVVDVQDDR